MAEEDESKKLSLAAGGDNASGATLSEKDKKLLEAFHSLHMDPEINNADDLVKFMRKFGTLKSKVSEHEVTEPKPYIKKEGTESVVEPDHEEHRPVPAPRLVTYQYPKISSFGGESGKGEVSFECFKFEVYSLVDNSVFSPEQILHGIRKAVKGEVAEILRRLGTAATIQEIMTHLESTYWNIETRETIMKRFYNCCQQPTETITTYATRLEEYFDKAVLLGVLKKTDLEILKGVLYQGLRKDLKHLATYKCDTISDYNRFKVELRKLEADMKIEHDIEKRKPCRPVVSEPVVKDRPEKGNNTEVMDILKKITERMDQIEKTQKSLLGNEPHQYTPYVPRGARRGQRPYRDTGQRGFGDRGGRGRGTYQPGRPLGSNTFVPTCWRCSEKGHVQTNCPN